MFQVSRSRCWLPRGDCPIIRILNIEAAASRTENVNSEISRRQGQRFSFSFPIYMIVALIAYAQVFSYVVHKKDAGSPSRTAPQPPVCSNLALHHTANNWLNWRGIGGTTIGHATRKQQTTQENTCVLLKLKTSVIDIC